MPRQDLSINHVKVDNTEGHRSLIANNFMQNQNYDNSILPSSVPVGLPFIRVNRRPTQQITLRNTCCTDSVGRNFALKTLRLMRVLYARCLQHSVKRVFCSLVQALGDRCN